MEVIDNVYAKINMIKESALSATNVHYWLALPTSDARFRFRNRNRFRNDSIFGWNRNQENWIVLESELESESCI